MTKISTLPEVIQVFGKNPNLVRFEKSYYFSPILRTENFQNSEPDTSVKLDIINWRKRSISAFSVDDFPSIFKFEWKIKKVWMSPKTAMGNT